ncbi:MULTISPECIES: hypothetical protein [Corynebacterium]|uniref:Uncharacterized protein n=2 Tax=Corynebacterium TaxID=1716 RepID=A0A269PIG8_9CORY|nr:hypothetical protein [Corynebacterium hadale]PAJ71259.1 hypothetical protein CIG21_00550 [Corynebacterium hadale]PAT09612.1 hypothetical protein CKJ80_10690 [Corynebacterium hadale]WKC59119.1 hypothetical protein CHAD_01010 [Corynebacterium hadale]
MSFWTDRATLVLTLNHGFSRDAAEQAAADAAAHADADGLTPEAAFGKADEWAESHAAEVRDDLAHGGTDPFMSQGLARPPRLAWIFFVATAGFAIGLTVATWNEDVTLGMAITPAVLALGLSFTLATYWRLYTRMAKWKAAAIATVPLVALSLLGAWAIMALDAISLPFGNGWSLILALIMSAAAFFLPWKKQTPDDATYTTPAAGDWDSTVAGELRARGEYREREIREVLAEAHAFAEENGTTVEEEFGDAKRYAHSLPSRPKRKLQRAANINAGVFLLTLANMALNYSSEDGPNMVGVGLFGFAALCSGAAAIQLWFKMRRS